MKQYLHRFLCCFMALLYASTMQAQLKLSLEDCETLFRKNNMQLLASHYQIDEAKAAKLQARIWEQPSINVDLNVVNPQNKQLFDIGNRGQKAVQIQQLIYLGGKKRNEIAWNQNNVEQAELIYDDLIRELVFELRIAYYDIHFSDAKAERITNELQHIDTLLNAYQVQQTKGNISLKEMVRLQSLSFSLRNELVQINITRKAFMGKVQLICGIDSNFSTAVDDNINNATLLKSPLLPLPELLENIKNNNPAYLLKIKEVENKQRLLAWQKSLNTPDLLLGTSYDQRGGAFTNQVNINFGMTLPFWQKNKGNIKAAQASLNKSDILKTYAERDLDIQVQTILYQLKEQQNLFRNLLETGNDVQRVYEGIVDNFQKRNISLLEFTDFIESYNERLLNVQELKKQIVQQQQWLNYLANKNVF